MPIQPAPVQHFCTSIIEKMLGGKISGVKRAGQRTLVVQPSYIDRKLVETVLIANGWSGDFGKDLDVFVWERGRQWPEIRPTAKPGLITRLFRRLL